MKRLIFFGLMAFALGASFDKEKGVKTSTASYYHDKFNGRKTASGEIFDNKKLTAANKTLPFGTKVKITNLKNEKSVIVRVNDRGPFSRKRAFDLSKAAFSKIADIRSGVASINCTLLIFNLFYYFKNTLSQNGKCVFNLCFND